MDSHYDNYMALKLLADGAEKHYRETQLPRDFDAFMRAEMDVSNYAHKYEKEIWGSHPFPGTEYIDVG